MKIIELIKKKMFFQITEENNGILACSNIDVLNYKTFKSAYNPLYPDTGKVVLIPEDILYKNTRHHLKEFIIIDGKLDKNNNHVIIGFLGSSDKGKNNVLLTPSGKNTDIKYISRIIVTKTKYKQLIKKSKTKLSNKIITEVQMNEIKLQSQKEFNIKKSKEFRK